MENEYAVFDKNGLAIEKSQNFAKGLSGYVTDIVDKSRSLLKSEDSTNTVEIFFEKKVLIIKDNPSTNLHMAMIVDNNK
jgi:hypothetical protein